MLIKKRNKNKQGCMKIGALGICATVGVVGERKGIEVRI